MKDLVTYCADSTALVQEVGEKFPELLTEEFDFSVTKIPTYKCATGETVCLVRCIDADDETKLRSLTTLEVLGTYDEVFADPLLDAKYKSVYPYDVPVTYTDDEGVEKSYTRPNRIGAFA